MTCQTIHPRIIGVHTQRELVLWHECSQEKLLARGHNDCAHGRIQNCQGHQYVCLLCGDQFVSGQIFERQSA